MSPQALGVELDLELALVAADAGDLGDALHALERVAQLEVLERPQLGEVVTDLSGSTRAYSNTQPIPVASGPRVTAAPSGRRGPMPARYSCTRERAQ